MHGSNDIIDIGVNLAHRSFRRDRTQVIERAFASGVGTMIITGTSIAGSQEALRIAQDYPGQLFATAGVHPHDSRHCTETTISELQQLASQKAVVAIGECGLDFNRDFSPRPEQEKWFEAQVALAEELQLPLFLHERDARLRFCEILTANRKRVPAVLHCFTGTREELKTDLNIGLHLGITGWICDERRGMHLRELLREIPLDRLMIETDAHSYCHERCPPGQRMVGMSPAFCLMCCALSPKAWESRLIRLRKPQQKRRQSSFGSGIEGRKAPAGPWPGCWKDPPMPRSVE
jgi:TatD DNase family protein